MEYELLKWLTISFTTLCSIHVLNCIFTLGIKLIDRYRLKNVIVMGEILDDNLTDLELELSYPVWEVCNDIYNSPLDWKKDNIYDHYTNFKTGMKIWMFDENRIYSLTTNNIEYKMEDLSYLEHKCLIAKTKKIDEVKLEIDRMTELSKIPVKNITYKYGGIILDPGHGSKMK